MKNSNATIDYSALDNLVVSEDIQTYLEEMRPKQYFTKKNLIIISSLLAVYILMSIVMTTIQGSSSIWVFLQIILAVVVMTLLVVGEKASLKRRAIMYRFAKKNGMSFIEGGKSKYAPGMIFDEGHSRQVTGGYVLKNGIEIANYKYTVGHGKNSQTFKYAYVEIPLKRSLPHMVLDAKSNNFMNIVTGLPDSFNKSQTLSLEGNFDKFFTLYTPKKYERDALYVFTPDVMAKLIDECKQFDIEIVDNKMYMYKIGTFKLQDVQQLKSIFGVVETISGELQSQTKRYADERVFDAKSANVVSSEGQRLKKSQTTAIIATVFIIIGILLQILL